MVWPSQSNKTIYLLNMKDNIISAFFKNLRFFLFSKKGFKRISELKKTQNAILLELVSLRYKDSNDPNIQLALRYLKENNNVDELFPYALTKNMDHFECLYDKRIKLPYIIHKGHRLYFPKTYKKDHIEWYFRFAIENDDIIGTGYRERTPHQYISKDYSIEQGAVLIDAGAAEGLFSLEMIDKVKKVYLVECDPVWKKPLQCTFEPWHDKVELITKKLSDRDDNDNVSIQSILRKEQGENIFIKMDIEGYEIIALQKAKELLSHWGSPLTLACCTYHRESDYEAIQSYFDEIGYASEVSNGYILTNMNDGNGIFSLRHGVIRASNQKR